MGWILPHANSTFPPGIDRLYYVILIITGIAFVLVEVGLIWFSVAYRARPGRKAHYTHGNATAEIIWTAIPAVTVVALGIASAGLWNHIKGRNSVPADAIPYGVKAKQFEWNVTYNGADGQLGTGDDFVVRNQLHVPMNRPILVNLESEDAIHSFFVPSFRLKQDAVPGRYTTLVFTPTGTGTFDLRCGEYCGTDHARMGGRIVVMAPQDFQRFLAGTASEPSMAARGFETFRRLGCSGCHDARSTVHAPDLDGLFGRVVHLQDGRTIVADEAYIRDSMLLPKKDVVAGFEPVMPSFQGQATEGDILEIIAYIKSTAGPSPRPSPKAGGALP